MVFDWDDFGQYNHRLDLLHELKRIRPDFRCTLFAIPTEAAFPTFWDFVPDWCELAMHGWRHDSSTECADWDYDRTVTALCNCPPRLMGGWKAPGWQISTGTYQAVRDAGWWCADQPYNRDRRPDGLRVHELNVGPDHWHGHIQNTCDNGLEETWDTVVSLVREAPSFEFMSEVVRPWVPEPVAAWT